MEVGSSTLPGTTRRIRGANGESGDVRWAMPVLRHHPRGHGDIVHCPLSIKAAVLLFGGLAQLARAPALQAGGQRFESVILHTVMAVTARSHVDGKPEW